MQHFNTCEFSTSDHVKTPIKKIILPWGGVQALTWYTYIVAVTGMQPIETEHNISQVVLSNGEMPNTSNSFPPNFENSFNQLALEADGTTTN